MKSIAILLTGTVLLSFNCFSQVPVKETDKIVGLYWSPKKDAKLQVYKKGDHFFGRSVWLSVHRKDSRNPDAALRNRELLGIELLSNFSYSNGTYTGGKIYDPESGKTYDCRITWAGEDLKVRGYIGISLFGRTEIFERIQSN
ncbi:MAG: DUF2147 domain-containing protein [Ferruginibacter sp.]